MKTFWINSAAILCQVFFGVFISSAASTINVTAIDSEAREIPPWLDIAENPAIFRIARTEGTNNSLSVAVRLTGTASNGIDYAFISNSVTIPAGRTFADVFISAIYDTAIEGTETVVLTVVPSPCLECYIIGSNSTATVHILDFGFTTNTAPTITFWSPSDGATFFGTTNIELRASAQDKEDGNKVTVEFLNGDHVIGYGTFLPTLCPANCPYFALTWSNVAPGSYTLNARVTDSAGATTISPPVRISVAPSNAPPRVVIVTPHEGDSFPTGTNIFLGANPTVQGGVQRVDFFSGETFIGRAIGPLPGAISAYGYTWSNPPAARHTITAVVTDGSGMKGTSEPVHITVTGSTATNTAPAITFWSPSDGATYFGTTNIELRASAQDKEDGNKVTVEFLNGDHVIGYGTFLPTLCPANCPYFALTWSNVAPGSYTLNARVTDSAGATTISPPVHISVAPSNAPPRVVIVTPHEGDSFPTGTNIFLGANPTVQGGVQRVDFFSGETFIGRAIGPLPGAISAYGYTWSNPPAARHTITAVVTDGSGMKGTSEPVHITVTGSTATNTPPTITFWSPSDGTTYFGTTNIELRASAQDKEDGNKVTVEFLNGDHVIGYGTFLPTLCPANCPYFALTWSNVAPGSYTLNARVTDSAGATMLSPPVHISVAPSNAPPRVVIVTPHEGDNFPTGTNIFLGANPTVQGGVQRVDFFSGETFIGRGIGPLPGAVGAYGYTWSNPPAARHTITAVVTDGSGMKGTSEPVHITVTESTATNTAPTITFWSPSDGTTYFGTTNIELRASAQDKEDGNKVTVEFLNGDHVIGRGTFFPTLCPGNCPYFSLTWSNVAPGSYTLNARVTDSAGATAVAGPVHLKVSGTEPELTRVSVVAADPNAAETGVLTVIDDGRFEIRRSGNLQVAIPVSFRLTGSASNGVDYLYVSNRIVIPAGATQAVVRIVPLNDTNVEGTETVVLTIEPVVCIAIWPPPPECYVVSSPTQALVSIFDVDRPAVTSLIPTGSVWSYLDNGSDQGMAWRSSAFDDSAWPHGPAQLGYGDGDEATVVGFGSEPGNKFITTYFRKTFNLSDLATFSKVTVRLLRDDGGVVYLNGVEVFRSNMPEGPINYQTLAPVNVCCEDETTRFYSAEIDPSLLSAGRNTVAVEIHQNSSISADLSFDLELVGTTGNSTVTNRSPTVTILAPTNGAAFSTPAAVLIEAVTRDPDGYATTVDFFAGDHKIGSATVAFFKEPAPGLPIQFEFSWTNPPPGTQVLRATTVDNTGHAGTSAPVTVTIGGVSPLDSDHDGVVDSRDQCPNTKTGAIVNGQGCSIAQLCPCDGQWVGHTQYVECVTRVSGQFAADGLLSTEQRAAAVKEAEGSNCGQHVPVLVFPVQDSDDLRTQGGIVIVSPGEATRWILECSSDLTHWTPIQTNTVAGAEIRINDPEARNTPARFYRVRTE